jgi:hypothetical protein
MGVCRKGDESVQGSGFGRKKALKKASICHATLVFLSLTFHGRGPNPKDPSSYAHCFGTCILIKKILV